MITATVVRILESRKFWYGMIGVNALAVLWFCADLAITRRMPPLGVCTSITFNVANVVIGFRILRYIKEREAVTKS